MIISLITILPVLKAIEPIVPLNSPIEAMTEVLFTFENNSLNIRGGNDEAFFNINVDCISKYSEIPNFSVSLVKLTKYLALVDATEMVIKPIMNDKVLAKVRFVCGKGRITLPVQEEKYFHNIPKLKDFDNMGNADIGVLKEGILYCGEHTKPKSDFPSWHESIGIRIEGFFMRVFGCDGSNGCEFYEEGSDIDHQVNISIMPSSWKKIERILPNNGDYPLLIMKSKNGVSKFAIQNKDSYIGLGLSNINYNFDGMQHIMHLNKDNSITINRFELLKCLERVSLFAPYDLKAVTFDIKEKEMILRSQSEMNDNSTNETIKINGIGHKHMMTSLPSKKMIGFLKKLSCENISLQYNNSEESCYIIPFDKNDFMDNVRTTHMPMHILTAV